MNVINKDIFDINAVKYINHYDYDCNHEDFGLLDVNKHLMEFSFRRGDNVLVVAHAGDRDTHKEYFRKEMTWKELRTLVGDKIYTVIHFIYKVMYPTFSLAHEFDDVIKNVWYRYEFDSNPECSRFDYLLDTLQMLEEQVVVDNE